MNALRELYQQSVLDFCLACIMLGMVFAALLGLGLLSRRLFRRGLAVGLCALLVLFVVVRGGGSKPNPTNALDPSRVSAHAVRLVPMAVDEETSATSSTAVTNLCFTEFFADAGAFGFGAAWPAGQRFLGNRLFLYGTTDLSSPDWRGFAELDVSDVESNVVAEVSRTDLPREMSGASLFLKLLGLDADIASTEDADGDGVPDVLERLYGTDVGNADSDGDGLADGDEIRRGTDPMNPDSDGDRLADGEEVADGSDPLSRDTDGDGVDDLDEIRYGTFPTNPDSDGDGIGDWEALACGAVRPAFSTVQEGPALNRYYEMGGANVYSEASPPSGRSASNGPLTYEDGEPLISPDIEYDSWAEPFYRIGRGAFFRALRTGRYFFGFRDADDRVDMSIGDVQVCGEWRAEGSYLPETSAVLIGGQDYDITVVSTNAGGPSKLLFAPGWGRFEPIERPSVSAGFSKSVILCKEIDGAPVRWNELTVLDVRVRGGELGATLEIETENIGRLSVFGSNPLPTASCRIESNEERLLRVVYRGVSPSEVTNDVRVVARLIETGSYEQVAATTTVTVARMAMYGDYDRVGGIGPDDRRRYFVDCPVLRHWINDDSDSGGTAEDDSDIPLGSGGNAQNAAIDGLCDLLDFTPVYLELGPLLNLLGEGECGCSLWIRQNDGAVNGVWTDLRASDANLFLTSSAVVNGTAESPGVLVSPVFQITSGGVRLPSDVLAAIREDSGRGVVLLEGRRATRNPLMLELRRGDEVLVREEMPLQISKVTDMMRWINLRWASGESVPSEKKSRLGVPYNLPDDETTGKKLVFLHGVNVTQDRSVGWSSEVFKRLRQSGSNAGFVGVSWRSDIGLTEANFHENASNAFETAAVLAPLVRSLPGRKVMMAHSLGNMVVSSMIQDHRLPVERYMMCDSSVPSEAYYPPDDISIRVQQLVHPDWVDYPTNSWASNWHKLFMDDPQDDRRLLGWPGRFLDVADYAVNFYSSGDEVLELYANNDISVFTGITDSLGYLSWHKQELFKGRSNLTSGLGGTDWSGWGFRNTIFGWPRISADEARLLSPRDLQTNTVFRLQPTSMATNEIPFLVRAAHLTHGIPALTPATGVSRFPIEIMTVGTNYDMNSNDEHVGVPKTNGWPERSSYPGRWLHSDLKNVAYFFNFNLYRRILSMGGLQ
ncbi:MAG: alpha/beta hydrolase [Kiritimatiellia bacterium]